MKYSQKLLLFLLEIRINILGAGARGTQPILRARHFTERLQMDIATSLLK
jgi:hypothetical protein